MLTEPKRIQHSFLKDLEEHFILKCPTDFSPGAFFSVFLFIFRTFPFILIDFFQFLKKLSVSNFKRFLQILRFCRREYWRSEVSMVTASFTWTQWSQSDLCPLIGSFHLTSCETDHREYSGHTDDLTLTSSLSCDPVASHVFKFVIFFSDV